VAASPLAATRRTTFPGELAIRIDTSRTTAKINTFLRGNVKWISAAAGVAARVGALRLTTSRSVLARESWHGGSDTAKFDKLARDARTAGRLAAELAWMMMINGSRRGTA